MAQKSTVVQVRFSNTLRLRRVALFQLGDLVDDGQELVVARGGRGGRGNVHFQTSTNRAPDPGFAVRTPRDPDRRLVQIDLAVDRDHFVPRAKAADPR